MVFYQILQYGRLIGTHHDEEYTDEKGLKEVCNRIVAKANKLVKKGELLEGDFEVVVCKENGQEIDSFISGTDYKY